MSPDHRRAHLPLAQGAAAAHHRRQQRKPRCLDRIFRRPAHGQQCTETRADKNNPLHSGFGHQVQAGGMQCLRQARHAGHGPGVIGGIARTGLVIAKNRHALSGQPVGENPHGAAQGERVIAKRIDNNHPDGPGASDGPMQKTEGARERKGEKGRKRAGWCARGGRTGHQRRSRALQDFSSGRVRGM